MKVAFKPGMILRGNPSVFLPGNNTETEGTKEGEYVYSGSYNNGELDYIKYKVVIREVPNIGYECISVEASIKEVLVYGSKEFPIDLKIEETFLVTG